MVGNKQSKICQQREKYEMSGASQRQQNIDKITGTLNTISLLVLLSQCSLSVVSWL